MEELPLVTYERWQQVVANNPPTEPEHLSGPPAFPLHLLMPAARELGRKQIRSNVIQPGPIDTDMNPADGDKADFQKMMVPIGRYGTVDEISSLATFLASDESSYVNAAVINADGGMNS